MPKILVSGAGWEETGDPPQAAHHKRGIRALGLRLWDFTQDCYCSPAGNGEHAGEQTTGKQEVVPGSRHRLAYTEPEVTRPWGSLPFTWQSLLEATTPENRLQLSQNGQAPHRTPPLPSLRQAGAGQGAGDEAQAQWLLRCPHPCPRPAAAASQAWGSPVNDGPLCSIVQSPSQACGAKRPGGGEKGAFLREKKAAARLFRPTLRTQDPQEETLSQNT